MVTAMAEVFHPLPDREQALALIEMAQNSEGFIAVDTETNGEDIRTGEGYLIGTSISFKAANGTVHSFYLAFRHDLPDGCLDIADFLDPLRKLFGTKPLVFFNFGFDVLSLTSAGIRIPYDANYYDAMILLHMMDENALADFGYSLDNSAKHVLKIDGKLKTDQFKFVVKRLGWSAVPAVLMNDYASHDAYITYRLGEYVLTGAKEEKLSTPWRQKKQMIKVLNSMEGIGVKIDQDKCRDMADLGESKMEAIKERLGLNPASPKDLKVLLIDEMKLPVQYHKKTGQPTFDKEAMLVYDELLAQTDSVEAKLITAFRGWQKTVSSNYRAYLDLVSPDGRLRPGYKMTGTRTGRLSCAKPNLQQIPKITDNPWNKDVKSCFIPEDGFVLMEADYSQLELRLGTAYAGELSLRDVFEDDRDIFTEMSSELGLTRQQTKTLVYSMQYGGGVKRVAEVFHLPLKEAAAIRQNYFDRYPGFKIISDRFAHQAKRFGKVQLWSGRYRHFRYPESEAHKAFNSVIQGGAADIVERQMIRLHTELNNNAFCRMLLQVHDSVVFEIKENEVDSYISQIREIMENVEDGKFGVRFKVDIHKWGE